MRQIFVGDVHGCFDELHELLSNLALSLEDRVTFLGDYLDRGPKPAQVVQYIRSLGQRAILGNHDEKCVRFLRHEERAARQPGYVNRMVRPAPAREAEWRALSEEDRAFLAGLPPYLVDSVGSETWCAVHGGLVPGVPPAEQNPAQILRCRWIDEHGHQVTAKVGADMPPGARPWMEVFDGEFHVACGHAVYSLREPRVDRTPKGFEVWSLDTGCCFGGYLSALVLDPHRPGHREVVQVKARREYVKLVENGVGG
jgi:hypothetical protein